MSIDVSARGSNDQPPARVAGERHGFFSLYKRGQGYWTRLGTALGAGAVILFIACVIVALAYRRILFKVEQN